MQSNKPIVVRALLLATLAAVIIFLAPCVTVNAKAPNVSEVYTCEESAEEKAWNDSCVVASYLLNTDEAGWLYSPRQEKKMARKITKICKRAEKKGISLAEAAEQLGYTSSCDESTYWTLPYELIEFVRSVMQAA